MTSLSETALTFAKECMGWEDAVTMYFPARIHSYKRHRKFDYYDLNVVMEVAQKWCGIAGLWISTNWSPDSGLWRLELFHAGYKSENQAESGNLCEALMFACVEAARRLNEQAA